VTPIFYKLRQNTALSRQRLYKISNYSIHRKVCEPVIDGKRVVIFPHQFVLHGLRHTTVLLTSPQRMLAQLFT
jgi:hypothetical protein